MIKHIRFIIQLYVRKDYKKKCICRVTYKQLKTQNNHSFNFVDFKPTREL